LKNKVFKKNLLADYITVFDWNGKIKKMYKVKGGLLDLAVDEATNIVYFVTKDEEGEEVVGSFNM